MTEVVGDNKIPIFGEDLMYRITRMTFEQVDLNPYFQKRLMRLVEMRECFHEQFDTCEFNVRLGEMGSPPSFEDEISGTDKGRNQEAHDTLKGVQVANAISQTKCSRKKRDMFRINKKIIKAVMLLTKFNHTNCKKNSGLTKNW
ncbi:hypothetical protein ACLOJK_013339 [Asimina triloba]